MGSGGLALNGGSQGDVTIRRPCVLGKSSGLGGAPSTDSDLGQVTWLVCAVVCSSVTWLLGGLREMSYVQHLECAGHGASVPTSGGGCGFLT